MTKSDESNVVRGPWTTAKDYAQRTGDGGQAERLDRIMGKAPLESHHMRTDADRNPTKTTPWIRTKKNGANVSRLGMNILDSVILALFIAAILAAVFYMIYTGHQFSFWGWACQDNQCQWISNIINQGGRQ